MNNYCKFLEDVYHNDELIWEKDKEYLITHENETIYYFGEPISSGITKDLENKKYKIISLNKYDETWLSLSDNEKEKINELVERDE